MNSIQLYIVSGSSEPSNEAPLSHGYTPRYQTGFEGRYSQYSRYKDPDTISQTSFRSINEVDYGRIQDTQENERLLFQVDNHPIPNIFHSSDTSLIIFKFITFLK